MAKLILNPIFKSISGRSGNTVFYTWKNIQCARSYVVPRNPDTETQRKNRNIFSEAVKIWQKLPDMQKESWNLQAQGKPLSGYNLFISCYVREKINTVGHDHDITNKEKKPTGKIPIPYQLRIHSVPGPLLIRNAFDMPILHRLYAGNGPPVINYISKLHEGPGNSRRLIWLFH